jgi:hypothetical protein
MAEALLVDTIAFRELSKRLSVFLRVLLWPLLLRRPFVRGL